MKIVLIRPETGGNIGATARAMVNFGFEDLVLVDPVDIDEEVKKRAKHAKFVVQDAEIWNGMKWENFDLVIGTSSETAGDYNVRRNALTPEELREKIEKVEGEIALVFGPEGEGLHNEDIEKCDVLVSIPTNEEYKTMNLSHSVAVILYELSKRKKGERVYELAGKEKNVLMEKLEEMVEEIDIEDYRKKKIKLSLENIFGRGMVSSREANTLIGFFRSINRKIKENL